MCGGADEDEEQGKEENVSRETAAAKYMHTERGKK
jgi:hypothetical protein